MKFIKQYINSIKGKITLGIIITLLISIFLIGGISTILINNGFDTFIQTQNNEGFGYGGRNQSDERRLERYQEITTEFKSSIIISIIISSSVGFIISVGVGFYLSNRISGPLSKLKDRLKELRENDFRHIKIDTDTKEILELAEEYNKVIDELTRIENLREDLVSDVTHELKTPLTKILGKIEGVIDGVYDFNIDHMKKIRDNANQLKALIESLEKVIQIRSEKYSLYKTTINLFEFIDSIIAGLGNGKVEIKNKIPKSVFIEADKLKLREILDNLLSNALRHTQSGDISFCYEIDKNILIIEDTGSGIAEKDIPYVFERFYRADRSRSKETGGFGLGLAITQELVEAHGWEIEVTSKLGKGTSFKIFLK